MVPGNVLLTGTPHGVSRLQGGDEVVVRVVSPSGEVLSEGRWMDVDE